MKHSLHIVALAGGVGGAKLAHGLSKILPAGHLTIIGNVGDDFVHYGMHISPDLDTVMYTLTDRANPATGWGLVNESWQNKTMMTAYGEDIWFSLGDRDLATHILRTHWLSEGRTLTDITAHLCGRLGLGHHLLPATNDPLRTIVATKEHGLLPFQEYFVKHRWQPTVESVYYEGAEQAQTTTRVREAFRHADLIIICPSNPILSIAPILAVSEIRDLIAHRRVPAVLVSPLIAGRAVKGPTDKLMKEMGLSADVSGIARFYNELIDVMVMDTQDQHHADSLRREFNNLQLFATTTLMQSLEDRRLLSEHILNYISEATI